MPIRSPMKPMALLLLCLAASSGLAEEPAATATVEGIVELAGNPIAGARVLVHCTALSDYEAVAESDGSGYFAVSDVPLGGFSVAVFNSDDELIAEGSGTLETADETVTVELTPVS